MTLLRLFVTISLRKINEDNLNERDDYGVPFSEQQYLDGPCYITLFKYKSFDQSDPPEWPQILDIYSVVVLETEGKIDFRVWRCFAVLKNRWKKPRGHRE